MTFFVLAAEVKRLSVEAEVRQISHFCIRIHDRVQEKQIFSNSEKVDVTDRHPFTQLILSTRLQ